MRQQGKVIQLKLLHVRGFDLHTKCIQLLQPIKLADGRNIVICIRNCKGSLVKSSILPTREIGIMDSLEYSSIALPLRINAPRLVKDATSSILVSLFLPAFSTCKTTPK